MSVYVGRKLKTFGFLLLKKNQKILKTIKPKIYSSGCKNLNTKSKRILRQILRLEPEILLDIEEVFLPIDT